MRLVIADDHALFRESLRGLLEAHGHEVVAEAPNGAEAVRAALEHQPDLVLMDLRMPGTDGLEALRTLTVKAPGLPVVILTAVEDDATLAAAVRYGAQGYLLKTLRADRFLQLLDGVGRGEPALSPSVARRLLANVTDGGSGRRRGDGRLTAREAEITDLMVAGITSNRDLAERLAISENTVKFHMRNILEKLGLTSRAQVVAQAARQATGDPSRSDASSETPH